MDNRIRVPERIDDFGYSSLDFLCDNMQIDIGLPCVAKSSRLPGAEVLAADVLNLRHALLAISDISLNVANEITA